MTAGIAKGRRGRLAAVEAGGYDAFEKLAKDYEGPIFNFALKMCGHAEDAKDVLQETLLAAYQSLSSFRGESKLSTWFFKVAMSACHKMRRKGKFEPRHELSFDEFPPGLESQFLSQESPSGPEEIASRQERKKFLDDAIRTIPLGYRFVLILRDVQGFTTREVAEILQLPESAVKVRLHRARLLLKEQLAPLHETPGSKNIAASGKSDCREIRRLFSAYLEEDLQEGLCHRIRVHFRDCDNCAALCRSLKEAVGLCHRSKRSRVPASIRRKTRAWLQARISGDSQG